MESKRDTDELMLKRGQRRKLALAVNAGLIFGAVGLLAWAVLWPIDLPEPSTGSSLLTTTNTSPATTNGLDPVDDPQWSEQLAGRRLQGWAVVPQATNADVAQPTAVSQAPASGPLAGVQLTGTIIEPGKSFAMVVDHHGVVDLKPVGGILQLEPAGIRVDSIASRSIVVSYQGKSQELVVVKEAVSPAKPPGNNSGTTGAAATNQPGATSTSSNAQTSDMQSSDMPTSATATESPGLEAVSAMEVELDGLNYNRAGELSDGAAPGAGQ